MQVQLEIEFVQLLKIIRNLTSGKLKELKAINNASIQN